MLGDDEMNFFSPQIHYALSPPRLVEMIIYSVTSGGIYPSRKISFVMLTAVKRGIYNSTSLFRITTQYAPYNGAK